jgi:uncharacterized membrane protein
MKIQKLIYCNREDPRVFVYKHQRWKWVGVTLNLAHAKSIWVLAITLISGAGTALPLFFVQNWSGLLLSLIILALWTLALCYYYYRQAAKDLRQYPGELSAR